MQALDGNASEDVMPRRTNITLETVLKMGLALPEVMAETSWGAPALKVRGRMFACQAINKSAEPNSLCVRIDFDQRDELIAAEPEVYYLTDHYVDYRCVLVRLPRVHPDALRDLLRMGWELVRQGRARTRPTARGVKCPARRIARAKRRE